MRICAALPLCAAVLGIGGCGSPARVEKDIAPLTATVTSAGSVVYSPNVYSLDVTTTNLAEVDSDRLVFPGSGTHGIANRRAGDILVSALGGTTHFLRRVLSVTRTSTSLVVMTEPAAVTDAVQQANLQFQIPAVAVPAAAGPTGGLFGGVVDFAFAESWQCASGMFSCQLSDGMKLTPRILSGSYFAPNVYIDAQINIFNNNPVLLKFVVNAMPDAELKMGINIQGKGSYRVEGLLFETPDVLIPIGEVPTYANGQIVVGVEGEIYAPSVDVALDAGFQAGLSAGFEIDNGGAPQGIWSGGTFTPTFKAAFVGIGGEVRARRYVAAKVSWMVGIDKVLSAGPQLTVRKYWQARWYADSMTGFFEQDSSGHDVTVTGAVKEFGIQQSLSLKLADWTDDSQTTQFTGPFVVYPCIVANDGDYCGGENLKGFRLGTVGDLYHCTGGNVTSDVRCQYGCGPATGIDAIEGKRVACNPAPNNPCHSAADGNYCGNENVNGFNGGTLGLPASALVTCATGLVSHEMTCSGGCGPVSGGARVGCLTPFTRPSAPCGTGDLAGPNNGTCGPDGRVYYCYQGTWYIKDDCVAKSEGCKVNPPGVADVCYATTGTPLQRPNAPCGAGDLAGPDNGTCGPDGRVYYCYQGTWYVKDDCLAKAETCVVEPPGVADICEATSRRLSPPTAPCGAGNLAGPDNGMCGPDGRVYYCYQGVWSLKDDCVARGVACIVEATGVADHCTSGCSSSSQCGSGESCSSGRCVCPGPVCGTSCCGAGEWCGSGSRCCSGCGIGCPC